MQGFISGTSSEINVDGTDNSVGATPGTNGTLSNHIGIGAGTGGAQYLAGKITEAGVFPTTTSTQRGTLCHNQFAYWGTSTSYADE